MSHVTPDCKTLFLVSWILIVMASIHQYEYRDFIYEFLSILFELLGQSISILFTEHVLTFPLDSIDCIKNLSISPSNKNTINLQIIMQHRIWSLIWFMFSCLIKYLIRYSIRNMVKLLKNGLIFSSLFSMPNTIKYTYYIWTLHIMIHKNQKTNIYLCML